MIVDPKLRKRDANRAHYETMRDRQDAVLLRLDRGDLASLDAARGLLGLSRSAFVKLHLLPAAETLSARSREIEGAMRARRVSLCTFLARSIEAELGRRQGGPVGADACGREFDALFAPPDAEA